MEDTQIRAFLDKLTREEIIPVVPPVPNTDLSSYAALCHNRFANPKVGDTNRRLAHDGSNRQPKFIIPTAQDRVSQNASVTGLALVSALWCRYCFGTTDSGAVVEANDPSWARLKAQSTRAKTNPRIWLEMTDIYGDLGSNEVFASAFEVALNSLWAVGVRATLAEYLQ